jgi:hypothetical protein
LSAYGCDVIFCRWVVEKVLNGVHDVLSEDSFPCRDG